MNIPVGFIDAAAGEHFGLFLSNESTVWSVGFGGVDTNTFFFTYSKDGQLGINFDATFIHTPVEIPNLKNISKISAGNFHSLVVSKDGRLFTFGKNTVCFLFFFFDQPKFFSKGRSTWRWHIHFKIRSYDGINKLYYGFFFFNL